MTAFENAAQRKLVIALHCSGGGAAQWRSLAAALGDDYELIAPEHYGCDSAGPWTGEHALTLADEAARSIALIDGSDRKVHLVGHSYGGGVALHVALARPDRVASLTLYEPTAFHLLRHFELGANALEEIFIDYWNGRGAFAALRPAVQDAVVRWMPIAPLEFNALFTEPTPPGGYAALGMPVRAIRGEHAPAPTRIIAGMVPSLFPDAELEVVPGAGHMGPLTHAEAVNELIVRHIAACGTKPAASRSAA